MPVNSFCDAMRAEGLTPPSEIHQDGKLHRFNGTEGKSKNSWYVYYHDPELPAGAFGDWRLNINSTWCGKTTKTLSPEEKRAYAKRMEEAKKQREAEAEKLAAECREWCTKTWDRCPEATDHPYLTRKQVASHGLRVLRTQDDAGALMVPVRAGGAMVGMQFISPDGSKKFKTGTAKAGGCYPIGSITENTVVVCEGYATGASIHAATGLAVLVAFDAGNLQPVAEVVRGKLPDIQIVIAADNDAWCKITDDTGAVEYKKVPCNIAGKRRVNVGVTKATEAVKAVGGLLAVPYFEDVTTHPTDWNDLQALSGYDEIRRQFSMVLNPATEEAPPEPEDELPPVLHDDPCDDKSSVKTPFLCLGYDQGTYYYLPKGFQQVLPLRASEHTEANLNQLADLNWWESMYTVGKKGVEWGMVRNSLLSAQRKRGVYTNTRIRGRGAWEDAGRSVVHMGDCLIVDGARMTLDDMDSGYIYEASTRLEYNPEGTVPATNTEAHRLLELCDMLSWEKPIYGILLAGWCVLAPVCGALRWRPHLWITGGAGSGKSWVMDNVVSPVLGDIALQVQGVTTEAGVRQMLGNDGRPVLHDEAEGEDQVAQRRMQAMLELARQSSSDSQGMICKGSTSGKALQFRIRSAFCFSSIGVSATQQADVSRVSVLTLRADHDPHRFDAIKRFWAETITPEFCNRLRARGVRLIPTLRENAQTFSRAVAEKLGSQRTGDQVGALLAGAFSLCSTKVLTLDEAREWVEKQNWEEHRPVVDQRDEFRCLAAIMETILRVQGTRGVYDLSAAEMVGVVANGEPQGVSYNCEEVHLVLQRNGIRVSPDGASVFISNTHKGVEKILKETPWGRNWGAILARLPDAMKCASMRFSGGSVSRAVWLPIRHVVGEE